MSDIPNFLCRKLSRIGKRCHIVHYLAGNNIQYHHVIFYECYCNVRLREKLVEQGFIQNVIVDSEGTFYPNLQKPHDADIYSFRRMERFDHQRECLELDGRCIRPRPYLFFTGHGRPTIFVHLCFGQPTEEKIEHLKEYLDLTHYDVILYEPERDLLND